MKKIKYLGQGGSLFGIMIVNMILTVLSFSFYYPWAKAKLLRYHYSNTVFFDNPFVFLGTGKEMFIGYLKALGIFIVLFGLIFLFIFIEFIPGVFLVYLAIFGLIPLSIHGMMRYRMSRTTWKNIYGGYRGDLKEFMKLFFKGIGLTIITFGFYGPIFSNKIRKYITNNTRLGSLELEYDGDDKAFWILNIKGIFLTIITFGIYFFWFTKDLYNFFFEHFKFKHNDESYGVTPSFTAGKVFSFTVVNILMIIFTLGIAFPWVIVRTFNFTFDNVEIEEGFTLENLVNTEEEYKDATGEDLADMLDIGLGEF